MLSEVAKEAAQMFRWYEELHRAKPDHEKADRNAAMAKKLEDALATPAELPAEVREIEERHKAGYGTSGDRQWLIEYIKASQIKAVGRGEIVKAIQSVLVPLIRGDQKYYYKSVIRWGIVEAELIDAILQLTERKP